TMVACILVPAKVLPCPELDVTARWWPGRAARTFIGTGCDGPDCWCLGADMLAMLENDCRMDMQTVKRYCISTVFALGNTKLFSADGLVGPTRPLRQTHGGSDGADGRDILDHFHHAGGITLRDGLAADLRGA